MGIFHWSLDDCKRDPLKLVDVAATGGGPRTNLARIGGLGNSAAFRQVVRIVEIDARSVESPGGACGVLITEDLSKT